MAIMGFRVRPCRGGGTGLFYVRVNRAGEAALVTATRAEFLIN